MYLWLGGRVYKLTLYCLSRSSKKFNNVEQGMLFVIAQVCQGFSPHEWKQNGCMKQNHHFYGSLEHAVFHLSIQIIMKSY
jgi:hypothetical protein